MLCPICSSQSVPDLIKEGYRYYRCSECEFLFHRGSIPGGPVSPTEFYDHRYWEMERAEALRREKEDCFVRAVELLYLSLIPVRTLLDFGCGLGVTVKLLRERMGLAAVGVDISADFEETEYLHRCSLESLRAKYPPAHFDAIYSIEVFEHLVDPRATLAALNSLLKPGGRILINTQTQEYISRYDPEMEYVDPSRRGHISIYSLRSFDALAAPFGLGAKFMADRKYAVLLSPAGTPARSPHPENLGRIRMLGDWVPGHMEEYMRLVYLEEEFVERSLWADKLDKELEAFRAARRRRPAQPGELPGPVWRWLKKRNGGPDAGEGG